MSTDRPKGNEAPPQGSEAQDLPDEARVHDLLPPNEEPWEPPVKKVGERRVGGWATSARLYERRTFRPAGNSRRFWRKVEDDDPFLPQAPGQRISQEGHAVYAADRLVRMPDAPRVERPTEYAPPPPQPRRVVPPQSSEPEPQRSQRPEPTYTEEPYHAPRPRSVPPPRHTPVEEEVESSPPVDRRPPRVAHNPKNPAGRMRVGPVNAAPRETKVVDSSGRTATEVRQEREQWRSEAKGPSAPPPLRGYDDVLAILGDLAASEKLYQQGVKGPMNTDVVDTPRPKPKAIASPPPREPAPQPAPRPAPPPPQAAPPVDRTPPKPPSSPAPAPPVNRSPSGGGGGGGMDDLFGGGPQEGRMRIPRRSKKKASDEEEDGG